MTATPFTVSFVGPSGVGKTTLIERLVPRLRASGLLVGTVKHAPHGHEVHDKIGSDSARHRAAGADAVLLAGVGGAVLFLARDETPGTTPGGHHRPVDDHQQLSYLSDLVASHLDHLDVVLVEGYAPINDAVVTLHRAAVPAKQPRHPIPAWICVSDTLTGDALRFDEVDELAQRIVERVGPDRGLRGAT